LGESAGTGAESRITRWLLSATEGDLHRALTEVTQDLVERFAPDLAGLLEHPSAEIRARAAVALASDAALAVRAASCSDDPDWSVRASAACGLARTLGCHPAVERFLADSD